MALTTLNRSKTLLFIDTAAEGSTTSVWSRVDKSTIFDLALNPQTEDYDFIDDDNTQTELKNYKPSLDQEILTVDGNPIYDFMENFFYNLPSGEQAKRDVMVVFPKNIGSTASPSFHAWKANSTLSLGSFNTQDKKITWTINFGAIKKGTATVSDSGVPTFVEA